MQVNKQLKKYLNYLRCFIKSPRSVGTLAPSSPWLCQTMLDQVDWTKQQQYIAELGSADGILTKQILAAMSHNSTIDAYEIMPVFIAELAKIPDSRLHIIGQSAEYLRQEYDVIFSCLPLLSLPTKTSLRILQQIHANLSIRQGKLVLFQYTRLSEKLLNRYFNWKKIRVVKNIPPAYVYVCTPKKKT